MNHADALLLLTRFTRAVMAAGALFHQHRVPSRSSQSDAIGVRAHATHGCALDGEAATRAVGGVDAAAR